MATPTSLPATFVAGNVLTAAQMNDLRGAFRVLQVVQTLKTASFSTTSASLVDVTGLSVSITPTSATSKVLVLVSFSGYRTDVNRSNVTIFRGNAATGTNLASPTNYFAVFSSTGGSGSFAGFNTGISYLDSPATTSATTYQVAIMSQFGGTAYVANANTITAIEVSA